MPGIEEVARAAGVSTATVSRALRGLPRVSSSTRSRVLLAAAELGYVASPSASSLATGRTNTVGVVVPFVSRWFFANVVEGVEEVLRVAGYDLLLYNLGGFDDATRRALDSDVLRKRVDSVLVLSLPLHERELAALSALCKPVVVVGAQVDTWASVGIDDVQAAVLATEHLLGLGHERIAHIGGRSAGDLRFATPQDRRRGYRQAMRAAGVTLDPLLDVAGDFHMDSGSHAMRGLLRLADPPTAVFAASDEMAFGAMRVLREAGLSVPGDVSVVGIDDHEMSALLDLTTVAQPVREQGEIAARLLLEAMEGSGFGVSAPTLTVPTRLVVRASTAPTGRRVVAGRTVVS